MDYWEQDSVYLLMHVHAHTHTLVTDVSHVSAQVKALEFHVCAVIWLFNKATTRKSRRKDLN